MSEDIRDRLCRWGRSLFERGLTGGSSGNITVRTERRLSRDADELLPRLSRAGRALGARRRGPAHGRPEADQGSAAAHGLLRGAAPGRRRRPPPLDLCDAALVPRRYRSGRCRAGGDALCRDAGRARAAAPLRRSGRPCHRAADPREGRDRCGGPAWQPRACRLGGEPGGGSRSPRRSWKRRPSSPSSGAAFRCGCSTRSMSHGSRRIA